MSGWPWCPVGTRETVAPTALDTVHGPARTTWPRCDRTLLVNGTQRRTETSLHRTSRPLPPRVCGGNARQVTNGGPSFTTDLRLGAHAATREASIPRAQVGSIS